MGKSTISMTIFNSKLFVYQRVFPLPYFSHGSRLVGGQIVDLDQKIGIMIPTASHDQFAL